MNGERQKIKGIMQSQKKVGEEIQENQPGHEPANPFVGPETKPHGAEDVSEQFPESIQVLEVSCSYPDFSAEGFGQLMGDIFINKGLRFHDGFITLFQDFHVDEEIVHEEVGGDGMKEFFSQSVTGA